MKKFCPKILKKSFPQPGRSFPQGQNVLDTMSKNTYRNIKLIIT